MKESEKSKEEIILKKLKALEQSIRHENQKRIEQLFHELDNDKVLLKKCVELIDLKLSFYLSTDGDSEE